MVVVLFFGFFRVFFREEGFVVDRVLGRGGVFGGWEGLGIVFGVFRLGVVFFRWFRRCGWFRVFKERVRLLYLG